MMISIDGFFEGPDHDLYWHNVDEEFVRFAVDQLGATDTILFGRKTYEMMASFWPTDEAKAADPLTAEAMNETPSSSSRRRSTKPAGRTRPSPAISKRRCAT